MRRNRNHLLESPTSDFSLPLTIHDSAFCFNMTRPSTDRPRVDNRAYSLGESTVHADA